MEDYLKRGGGLISIHDTLCGDDPQYYSTIVGGSKLHGERNFSSGAIKYTIVDKASPIMKGMSDFEVTDEAFFKITWAKSPEVPPTWTDAGELLALDHAYEIGHRRVAVVPGPRSQLPARAVWRDAPRPVAALEWDRTLLTASARTG